MTLVARQAGDPHPAAVHRLGHDRVAPVRRGHDHIIGLGDADLEFVHLHCVHVLPVGCDDGHRHTGNSNVEEGHRRSVDDPQAHALARAKGQLQVILQTVPVDQEGVGSARHIGNVARVHPHLPPHAPHLAGHVALGRGLHLALEVMLAHLQLAHDLVRMQRRELGQQHHVVTVVARVGRGTLDDDRAVMPRLFLQARVRVPPVGAALADREFVGEGLARLDAGEADAGHPVELERHEQAVPVDRAVFVQIVRHMQPRGLALAQADQWPRHGAVYGEGVARAAASGEMMVADGKRDVLARHFAEAVARVRQRRAAGPGGHRKRAGSSQGSGAAD